MRFVPRSLAVVILVLLIVLPALGVGALYGIRAVESYNPFCTSCHLQDHQDYLDDGTRPKAKVRTLGGRHLSSGEVKCISCHGEEGITGMLRTTYLAAKDSVKFIIGDYKQPSRVFHPVADRDCVKCHSEARILKLEEEDFHAILDHATLPFGCVQCHNGHRIGGRPARRFIVPQTAQPRCDHCHNKLDQKVRVGQSVLPRNRDRLAGAAFGSFVSSIAKMN
ncbi:MAG: hypothetical protein HOC91_13270 [Nitrospinaceae bacterium]|jgi:cytochrome c-type protein NapC|nr:hypothetical protein [Nitrospinaceae bacterium]MBT3434125.1 hypothetical protein [Nitrospinaceae bacterium]MBT3820236.1 hypothetical protein [Nitrospinaceae bacterium]MBT4094553.1 hypothetical protein [Nitrospinaceae bacterium]MBT4431477.1 hypothetical protein [Nitrospinaceae bacterium]